MSELFDYLQFNEKELVPVIAQDADNGEVLMMAWMNREALKKTLSTGRVHYWSRSRNKLWLKGESSGHLQVVREVRIDCDGDALLIKIEQKGGACHEGYRSCFFRRVLKGGGEVEIIGKKVFSPAEKYPDKFDRSAKTAEGGRGENLKGGNRGKKNPPKGEKYGRKGIYQNDI